MSSFDNLQTVAQVCNLCHTSTKNKMSRKYKFYNPTGIYFVTFATVNWIDVFTRMEYKNIVVDSINYCIKNKGLNVYAWIIMSNHVHLRISTNDKPLQEILRDLKKYTAKQILFAIKNNPQESRKDWMLNLFRQAGKHNSNNQIYQFWQQQNQPMELSTSTNAISKAIDYIHNNPVKAAFVDKPENYPHSSAIDFAGGKGLIEIEIYE